MSLIDIYMEKYT